MSNTNPDGVRALQVIYNVDTGELHLGTANRRIINGIHASLLINKGIATDCADVNANYLNSKSPWRGGALFPQIVDGKIKLGFHERNSGQSTLNRLNSRQSGMPRQVLENVRRETGVGIQDTVSEINEPIRERNMRELDIKRVSDYYEAMRGFKTIGPSLTGLE